MPPHSLFGSDPLPSPQERLIAQVLRRYPGNDAILHCEILGNAGGFSGALIAKIEMASGTFCLRGWPIDSLPAARISGLHRLLREISQCGVTQVTVPIESLDRSTLVEESGRLWQLEPWMPGRADFSIDSNSGRLESAMACLASWHRAAARFVPHETEKTWFYSAFSVASPAIDERCQRLREWRGHRSRHVRKQIGRAEHDEFRELSELILARVDRLLPTLQRELDLMGSTRFAVQPCLRDIWHDHLLFTGDVVTGLIDASAARSENVATDLARLIGSLVGDDQPRRQEAIDFYQAHRPLTADELVLVELLDRSAVLIGGLNWIEWHYVDGRQFEQPARVIARLGEILLRLEFLTQTL